MSLLFSDGFDSYAAGSDLGKGGWTVNSPWTWGSTDGRVGGGAIKAATTGGIVIASPTGSFTGASNVVTNSIGFWLKVSAAPASLSQFFVPRDLVNTAATVHVRLTTSGFLVLYNSATPLFTGNINVCDGAWHWIEIAIAQATSGAGHNICYVDTVSQWNSAANQGSSIVHDHFVFMSIASETVIIDDVIAYDTGADEPSAITSIPLGPRQITTVRPDADSAVQFTPSTGTDNFAMVDEVNPDGDSTYVENGVSSEQDLYDYDDLPTTIVDITVVNAKAYVENPNPGTINFKQIAKSSATQTDGASVIAPPAYQTKQQPFPLNPDGAVAWTASAFNSAKFGVKVV